MSAEFDKVYETIPGNGWLLKEEAQLLWIAARDALGPILEVGSYKGRSTCLLASLGRTVYAVDPFESFDSDAMDGVAVQAELRENLKSRKIHNVLVFPQKIETWFQRPIGFAYLDGDHSFLGTLNQIRIAFECGALGVCIHDYADDGEGVYIKSAIETEGLIIKARVARMVWCTK